MATHSVYQFCLIFYHKSLLFSEVPTHHDQWISAPGTWPHIQFISFALFILDIYHICHVTSLATQGIFVEFTEKPLPRIGPGVNVIAAWPFKVGPRSADGKKMAFNSISGTSMYAPHLSGIAAIVKSAHPDWSPAAIKSTIMTSAYVLDDKKKLILDEKLRPAGHFQYWCKTC